jgi:hypothetical protein
MEVQISPPNTKHIRTTPTNNKFTTFLFNELASQNQVHPTQKRQVQRGATDLLANGRGMGTQMRSQEHSEFRQTLQQIKCYIINHTT